MMDHSIKLMKTTSLLALAVATLTVGGCSEYSVRSEYMSDDFGRALASNTAMQTVNLAPRSAQNTHLKTDGTEAANAIESYRAPEGSSDGPGDGGIPITLVPKTN